MKSTLVRTSETVTYISSTAAYYLRQLWFFFSVAFAVFNMLLMSNWTYCVSWLRRQHRSHSPVRWSDKSYWFVHWQWLFNTVNSHRSFVVKDLFVHTQHLSESALTESWVPIVVLLPHLLFPLVWSVTDQLGHGMMLKHMLVVSYLQRCTNAVEWSNIIHLSHTADGRNVYIFFYIISLATIKFKL